MFAWPFSVAVNDAFLSATSRTREQLVGVSLSTAFAPNPHAFR